MMFARVLPGVPAGIDCAVKVFWQFAAASEADATTSRRLVSTVVHTVDNRVLLRALRIVLTLDLL